jgi:hypothetical protein
VFWLCGLQDFLRSGCDLEVSLKDLRLLLPTLSADAAAIAGQAVALSQWHQVGRAQPARRPAMQQHGQLLRKAAADTPAVMPVQHAAGPARCKQRRCSKTCTEQLSSSCCPSSAVSTVAGVLFVCCIADTWVLPALWPVHAAHRGWCTAAVHQQATTQAVPSH